MNESLASFQVMLEDNKVLFSSSISFMTGTFTYTSLSKTFENVKQISGF